MDAAATERDWFNLQDTAGLVLAKGMFLRLTIACCLASISAAQDIPQSATREIAAAANEFVATLGESQQGKLIYDFRDETQRKRRFTAADIPETRLDLSLYSSLYGDRPIQTRP
jgi:hypothetical protein